MNKPVGFVACVVLLSSCARGGQQQEGVMTHDPMYVPVPELSYCERRVYDGIWIGYRADAMISLVYSPGDRVMYATIPVDGDVVVNVSAHDLSGADRIYISYGDDMDPLEGSKYRQVVLSLDQFFGFVDGVCRGWVEDILP